MRGQKGWEPLRYSPVCRMCRSVGAAAQNESNQRSNDADDGCPTKDVNI